MPTGLGPSSRWPALPGVHPVMASCPGHGWRGCGAEKGHRPAHLHGLAGSGLCGNFNGDTTDDFTTSMGIAEGTASLFVDSWRAGNCPGSLERETDPCSMSQLNSECPAPGGCGVGRKPMQRVGDPSGLSPQRCVPRPTARYW